MASVSKERPNLKICIDNREDAVDSEESDGEIKTAEEESDEEERENEIDIRVSDNEEDETIPDSASHSSLSDNEQNNTLLTKKFIPRNRRRSDFDQEDEESIRRRKEERARRFGVKVPSSVASEVNLNKLYDSLGIKKKELEDGYNYRGIRLEAIHVRGVDNMKTKDLYDYFKDFPAKNVEWIDDCSCNVVWSDVGTSIRAMNALSQDPEDGIEETDSEDEAAAAPSAVKKDEDEDELNLMSDEEDMDIEEGEIKETDKPKSKKKKYVITPPGRWRVGKKYNKAKRLFIRFAMRADRKPRGAARSRKDFKVHEEPEPRGPQRPSDMKEYPEMEPKEVINRPTQVFEAIPDDYDLEETFGVVATKPKKTVRHSSGYVDYDREIIGPTYEETLAMYSQAAKERLMAQEKLGITADTDTNRPPKRRHSGSESDSSGVDYEEELETLLGRPLAKRKMRMYADDLDDEKDTLKSGLAQSKASVLDARSRIELRKMERKLNKDGESGNDLRRKLQKHQDHPPSHHNTAKFSNMHNLKVQIDAD